MAWAKSYANDANGVNQFNTVSTLAKSVHAGNSILVQITYPANGLLITQNLLSDVPGPYVIQPGVVRTQLSEVCATSTDDVYFLPGTNTMYGYYITVSTSGLINEALWDMTADKPFQVAQIRAAMTWFTG